MDTFAELITAVNTDMNTNSDSPLFTPEAVKLAINRAYWKSGSLFLWPETEDGKKTSTIANQEYYDYPKNWIPDSVWKLSVDGVDYGTPLVFDDYLYEKENNYPTGLKKMWTSQWRRYFIYPTPTTNGNNNISVWGQKVVDKLVNNADVTIFSYSMPHCNDAIVLEADAILKSKGENEDSSEFKSKEAKQILTIAWNKIAKSQSKYRKTTSFFEVPDFFAPNATRKQVIGDFS